MPSCCISITIGLLHGGKIYIIVFIFFISRRLVTVKYYSIPPAVHVNAAILRLLNSNCDFGTLNW